MATVHALPIISSRNPIFSAAISMIVAFVLLSFLVFFLSYMKKHRKLLYFLWWKWLFSSVKVGRMLIIEMSCYKTGIDQQRCLHGQFCHSNCVDLKGTFVSLNSMAIK